MWDRPLGLLIPVLGAIAMFALSACVLPFFLGLFFLGLAVEQGARASKRGVGTTVLIGFCMFAAVTVPSAGMMIATAAMRVNAVLDALHVVAVLAVPLLGMLVGPFVTVGPHLARRGGGLDDAFGRALLGANAAGWLTALLRGVVMGLGVLVVALYVLGMHAMLGDDGADGVVALVSQCVVLLLVFTWQVAFACACAAADDALLDGTSPPTAPVRLMLAPLVAVVVLLGAGGVAAITPLPPWQRRPHTPLTCEPELADHGPHGLSVRAATNGAPSTFVVATADGGGAGPLVDEGGREPLHVCLDHDGVVWVVWGEITLAVEEYDTLYVPIDERGVRLDDGILDRLSVRLGLMVGISVVLGFCCVLIGLLELGRRSALLDVVHRSDDLVRAAPGKLKIERGSVRVTGEVRGALRFESDDGTYAFSLPPKVRLVGAERALTKDAAALLVATEPLQSLSLRDGLGRWPASAVLIIGRPDDARRAISGELSRVVGLWSAVATLGFGIAAVAILAAL